MQVLHMKNRPLTRAILSLAGLAVIGAAVVAAEPDEAKPAVPAPTAEKLETAVFASGCFWCTESDFDKVDGVVETISGYTGGRTKNPTYEQVGGGETGHTEALLVRFHPAKVSYAKLLDHYWHNVDLVDGGGQFCDRGTQYRPAIFTGTPEQAKLAEDSKAALTKSGRFDKPIAVQIAQAVEFTAAEDYHQNYYKTNPLKYKYYRNGCGRDARLRQLWGSEATQ